MATPFSPLASTPDHPALEREILDWWDAEHVFDQLREANRGGPGWHFLDGPITANNPMGVHHAWGRSLKDIFQRYKALRGFDQRYQNGFDCQGLWVEVEVEKSLGLNSKRDIEQYGLAEFAERCKERVAHFAKLIIDQDRRLGRWMDWGNDYYTFSDTNIEYIWRFLKEVHGRGWLYKGHRSTQWCPRCGTSLSQHEQSGEENHVELDHPSLTVRFPLRGREGEGLAVWTTTPWTLPANVSAAVHPDAVYGLTAGGDWWAVDRAPEETFVRTAQGSELVGLEYEGPFDGLVPDTVVHRVIPWDEVSLSEGTGIVHIAPGAGTEDFELSRVHELPVIVPIDEDGRFYDGYGELAGLSTVEAEGPVIASLDARGLVIDVGRIVHRYPICWRCKTPLVFRVVDDWFISADEVRGPMLEANQTVAWTPAFYSKRMDDWLRNMGDWNISRKRYFGLPLPLYPCACGHLNVIGSRRELEQRATAGLEQLQELHRPWIDAVTIRCEDCGADVERIPEVGDAWLDAGIVAFSTLGWENPSWIEGGYGTGAAAGLTGADLPDHAYWEQWFPANWVSESREQIRLWFYSLCFMAVTFTGRSPYRSVLTYERVRDEHGREMHKSTGNAIEANQAFDQMGADIVRWLFSEQVPSQNINFGFGPAADVKRRLLTLWNSARFFVDYGNIESFQPRYEDLADGPDGDLQPLDRWLLARTQAFVGETTEAYERFWTPGVTDAFERFVDDVSNWYIRRSRRRFWQGKDDTAFRCLWFALVTSLRVIAPVMPFLADHLWRTLVSGACVNAPRSVFLAGWPTGVPALDDPALLEEIADVRRVVELGRQARATRGIKLRQPLRTAVVYGAGAAAGHADEIADELRVKEVRFEAGGGRVRFKPDLRVLGPRLGAKLPAVRAALQDGRYEVRGDEVLVEGETLGPGELITEPEPTMDGWAAAADGGVSVEVDVEVDEELEREGRALDLIRLLNGLRKDAGLELTDRIVVTLPSAESDLLPEFGSRIRDEVLAVRIDTDAIESPSLAKA